MEEKKTTNNTTTHIGEREIIMERIFDAPRELVFKVFTEPDHVARWWAPFGFTIPVCTIDLRPGGLWHYCMRSPEGDEHWVRSVYQEIVEPERVAYTSVFADEKASPVEGLPAQLGIVTFTELDGKTKFRSILRFTSAAELQSTIDMGVTDGIANTWNQLANYLEEAQSEGEFIK